MHLHLSRSALATLITAGFLALGCGGHSRHTEAARSALDAMRPKEALRHLNRELGVKSAQEVPEKVVGKNTLLLLDRAMVLQQLGDYELSSRDLEIADKSIEVMDFSRNAVDDISRYMFSDQSGPYRAPAYEKLLINTMNMVNYLARGDLPGARIEARRLTVMQKFIKDHKDPSFALLGPGSYFAGFVFERSGKPQEALRFYDEALRYGQYATLVDPVRRLSREASYRSPRIRKLLKEPAPPKAGKQPPTKAPSGKPVAGAAPKREDPPKGEPKREPRGSSGALPPLSEDQASGAQADKAGPEGGAAEAGSAATETAETATGEALGAAKEPAADAPPTDETGELLVIVNFGRVPAKEAVHLPIGLALTYCADILSPADVASANEIAAQGLVTWVNYPELGEPRGTWGTPAVSLGGRWQNVEGLSAVDQEMYRAWEDTKGAIVASAVTRMVTRAVAGRIAREADDGIAGLLISLGVQGAMVAADTPDTRSWSTLPARIAVTRLRVAPGTYEVGMQASGFLKQQTVTIPPRGWAVVNLTALN